MLANRPVAYIQITMVNYCNLLHIKLMNLVEQKKKRFQSLEAIINNVQTYQYSVFQVACPEEIKNGSWPCLYK